MAVVRGYLGKGGRTRDARRWQTAPVKEAARTPPRAYPDADHPDTSDHANTYLPVRTHYPDSNYSNQNLDKGKQCLGRFMASERAYRRQGQPSVTARRWPYHHAFSRRAIAVKHETE